MKKFKLKSDYKVTQDQKESVEALVEGIRAGVNKQVLLGVTGSGKTFTVANTIKELQRPTLIISHNKTLAAQLYQELKEFFPDNAVSFFVSYYDYYQPEAYIPSTDTYIEKDAGINELIDKLRLSATTSLLTRSDVIVVASVSCIYNIGSPKEYSNFAFDLRVGKKIKRDDIMSKLIELQYDRGDFGYHRGTFRVRGDTIDIYPAYQDESVRVELGSGTIKNISFVNSISGKVIKASLGAFVLYPAKHFITDPNRNKHVFKEIERDLRNRYDELLNDGKALEAHRLKQRVVYDLEMIQEVGYVKGIENYSRYFDGRGPGDPPYSLLDYFREPFGDDWMVVVDESHITFPQIRGMYNGDQARKKTLIDYGFRLPSAIDNRPLTFDEFQRRIPNFIATSATPSDWEKNMAMESASSVGVKSKGIVEQLLRPTGIPDPEVEIKPTKGQVPDVIKEIKKRVKKKQRTLVTTLTKRTAEDLADYLKEHGIRVHYLHSGVKTLDRTDILDDLRRGNYDCLVGINLLREGLDLPEVSLVAILDADKEGFLRSDVTLIQTMGRAARHVDGHVIMYADTITGSMKRALAEVRRRREHQIKINKKYGIKPKTIEKPIREKLVEKEDGDPKPWEIGLKETTYQSLLSVDAESLTPKEKKRLASKLRSEMNIAARDLNFELAAEIRDAIKGLD